MIAVINTMTKSNLGKEKAHLAYAFTSQFITKGSQGRNSGQELQADTNDRMLLTHLLRGSLSATHHLLPASLAQEWLYPQEAGASHTHRSQVNLVGFKLTKTNHHKRFT